ncbi:MAG: hypothetical protein JSW28_01605 [Thermoplasmata archaeon]|nr:MAG: hypothetical protein JSW28_01605 [Thermoplasmata archaeon]
MDVPAAIYVECPSCGEESLHRIIKGRLGDKKQITLDALVKCSSCGFRHHSVIKQEKSVSIPIIVSQEAQSKRHKMELPGSETINIGDEYQLDRGTVKITGIETANKRVKSAAANEVKTLWAKKFDRLKLKVSINKGSKTWSRTIWAVPDEEFFIGDVIRIKGQNVAIHAIKTKDRHIKTGGAEARDIVRLYAKVVR